MPVKVEPFGEFGVEGDEGGLWLRTICADGTQETDTQLIDQLRDSASAADAAAGSGRFC